MYWELSEAIVELNKRQNDQCLLERINKFLGNCPIPMGKRGFMARNIASCTFEQMGFVKRCESQDLVPMTLEYGEDKFCSHNPDKMNFVRMKIFKGRNKNGEAIFQKRKIVKSVQECENLPLSQILTDSGGKLIDFHHEMTLSMNMGNNFTDISPWLIERGNAMQYYTHFFLAMSVYGILFESFESFEYEEERFKQKVVLPAWKWVIDNFQIKPLIVLHPANPSELSTIELLSHYPMEAICA